MIPGIDFVLAGAQKSGTTTLYDWLRQVPDIYLPAAKEIRYFADDACYAQGERYLEPLYRDYGGQRRAGSAYVHQMYFVHAARRLHEYNPDARIIVVLRNPVDRAYSAFWFARRNGWETAATFEEALQLEPARLSGSYDERAELTYLDHGLYAKQLEPYFELFGPERIKVLITEDLQRDPQAAFGDTLSFLGVSAELGGIDLTRSSNVAATPSAFWMRFLLSPPGVWYKRLTRRIVPPGLRLAFREHVLLPLRRRYMRPSAYPAMRPDTRERLARHFQSENRRLADLLEREIDWD